MHYHVSSCTVILNRHLGIEEKQPQHEIWEQIIKKTDVSISIKLQNYLMVNDSKEIEDTLSSYKIGIKFKRDYTSVLYVWAPEIQLPWH